MKIPNSISTIYNERYVFYEILQHKVDTIIKSIKNPRWHYESRVKKPESFALKIETGRFEDPYNCLLYTSRCV